MINHKWAFLGDAPKLELDVEELAPRDLLWANKEEDRIGIRIISPAWYSVARSVNAFREAQGLPPCAPPGSLKKEALEKELRKAENKKERKKSSYTWMFQ